MFPTMRGSSSRIVDGGVRSFDADQAAPDIELPFKTRSTDALAGSINGLEPGVGRSAGPSLPFLVRTLLTANGPFGLEVDVKPDGRVVGVWTVDVKLSSERGTSVSQARGHLYVCASPTGDQRATGAFLVVRQWWVNDDTPLLQDQALYGCLSSAVLTRLHALLGSEPHETDEARSCVLYLVDGRRLARKRFRLSLLHAALVHDSEGEQAVKGIDLRIAHGRGTAKTPLANSTIPALFSDGTPSRAPIATRGEAFVAEVLSPANVLWNRRASDKVRTLMLAGSRVKK
jgi:hypothetical protein